ALVGVIVWSALGEEHVEVPTPRATRVESVLKSAAIVPQMGGGVLITGDSPNIEAVAVAGYRLSLSDRYTFIDLSRPRAQLEAVAPTERPPLYYGGPLDQLLLETLPERCSLTFFVEPDVEGQFVQAMKRITDD